MNNEDNEYVWLTEFSHQFLKEDYLLEGQTVDERITIICNRAEEILGIKGYAAKLKSYIKKGWYSLSTPIWTNFGTDRGCPISCFGSYVEDKMSSILHAVAEMGMMSKLGGGTSAYFGNIRGRGSSIKDNGTTHGTVHFMKLFDTMITTISQGNTRRGNCAMYLPIDHPDIEEFLPIQSDGHAMQAIFTGVTVTDEWMQQMIDGDVSKRKIWAKLLHRRFDKGIPYIIFLDNANNNTVDVYKDKGMKIHQSNLCSEIMLPNNKDESFVCDLSSMNIRYYDEWKNTDAVETLTFLLDAVMTEFIEKAKTIPYMDRAVRFAERHRAIGIGWLGWHSYLQDKLIPLESITARCLNVEIAETIQTQAYAASAKLAQLFGEPEVLKGYGRRNTTLTAIAPTKSSSFIIGQSSEGIEAIRANIIVKDLQKGKYTLRNPQLVKLLEQKGLNTDEIWESILKNSGSVQHLTCLTQEEKDVFKTFGEVSQLELVLQAAARQKFIDQSQSLNLLIDPATPAKDVNLLMIEAWKSGVKSLYYQIGVNSAQQLSRNILSCTACES